MEQVEEKNTGTFGRILLFVMAVIAMLIMFSIFYYLEDWRAVHFPEQEQEPEDVLTSGMLACIELGCPAGTNYIGSVNGATYHACDSTIARSINEENRVCFNSIDDAVSLDYRS